MTMIISRQHFNWNIKILELLSKSLSLSTILTYSLFHITRHSDHFNMVLKLNYLITLSKLDYCIKIYYTWKLGASNILFGIKPRCCCWMFNSTVWYFCFSFYDFDNYESIRFLTCNFSGNLFLIDNQQNLYFTIFLSWRIESVRLMSVTSFLIRNNYPLLKYQI